MAASVTPRGSSLNAVLLSRVLLAVEVSENPVFGEEVVADHGLGKEVLLAQSFLLLETCYEEVDLSLKGNPCLVPIEVA